MTEARQDAGDAPRRTLTATVAERLREAIRTGELRPGDRLPSEAGLTRAHGVSRTVIREAIAALSADGLVEARHGVGVFVLSPAPGTLPMLQPFDPSRISSIIEMLELRAAVEIEAAGLAAVRRSAAQEEALFERLEALEQLIRAGKPTTEADYAFHLALADAVNNPRFREFLEMMGRTIIPRATFGEDQPETAPAEYLDQIQAEHARLADAVARQDEDAAREAMRTHLKGSQKRYRDLIRGR